MVDERTRKSHSLVSTIHPECALDQKICWDAIYPFILLRHLSSGRHGKRRW